MALACDNRDDGGSFGRATSGMRYSICGDARGAGPGSGTADGRDGRIVIHGGMGGGEEYPPSEDTFFLADYLDCNIDANSGRAALDVGSGSGYITKLLCDKFDVVVGTDIDFGVLRGQHTAYRTENLVCCSGSDALSAKFDIAVCNPPYLATDRITHLATDGGPGGLEVPSLLMDSVYQNLAVGGVLLLVSTSLSDHDGLIGHAVRAGFADARIVSKKRLFFEELLLIRCTMPAPP